MWLTLHRHGPDSPTLHLLPSAGLRDLTLIERTPPRDPGSADPDLRGAVGRWPLPGRGLSPGRPNRGGPGPSWSTNRIETIDHDRGQGCSRSAPARARIGVAMGRMAGGRSSSWWMQRFVGRRRWDILVSHHDRGVGPRRAQRQTPWWCTTPIASAWPRLYQLRGPGWGRSHRAPPSATCWCPIRSTRRRRRERLKGARSHHTDLGAGYRDRPQGPRAPRGRQTCSAPSSRGTAQARGVSTSTMRCWLEETVKVAPGPGHDGNSRRPPRRGARPGPAHLPGRVSWRDDDVKLDLYKATGRGALDVPGDIDGPPR